MTTIRNLIRRLRGRAAAGGDAGFTLIETMVAVVLLGILSVGAWRAVIGSAHATDNFVDSATRESRLAIANEILANNIHDAWVVRSATADELVLLDRWADTDTPVTDEGVITYNCGVRDWKYAPDSRTLTLTAWDVGGGSKCDGDPGAHVQVLQLDGMQDFSFGYYTRGDEGFHHIDLDKLAGGRVEDGRDLGMVEWTSHSDLYSSADDSAGTVPLQMGSGASIRAEGIDPATGASAVQATKADPYVATAVPGADQPVLRWTDDHPDLEMSFVVVRIAWPETTPADSLPVIAWGQDRVVDQVAIADPSHPSGKSWKWIDPSLPAGWTAEYVVQPALKDGTWGPYSNSVETGLLPAKVTNVVAHGAAGSITVTWGADEGATSYDVYRGDTLIAYTSGNGSTSFTDAPGVRGWSGAAVGNARSYRIPV